VGYRLSLSKQALRLKQEELNQLMIRHEALERVAKDYEKDSTAVTGAKVDLEALEQQANGQATADGQASERSRYDS
jgi:hypothetical protein